MFGTIFKILAVLGLYMLGGGSFGLDMAGRAQAPAQILAYNFFILLSVVLVGAVALKPVVYAFFCVVMDKIHLRKQAQVLRLPQFWQTKKFIGSLGLLTLSAMYFSLWATDFLYAFGAGTVISMVLLVRKIRTRDEILDYFSTDVSLEASSKIMKKVPRLRKAYFRSATKTAASPSKPSKPAGKVIDFNQARERI